MDLLKEEEEVGAREERARIREEMKAEIFRAFEKLVAQATPGPLHEIEAAVLAALDRICPGERSAEEHVGRSIVRQRCSFTGLVAVLPGEGGRAMEWVAECPECGRRWEINPASGLRRFIVHDHAAVRT